MGILDRIKRHLKGFERGKNETPRGNEKNVPLESIITEFQCNYCDGYLTEDELQREDFKYLKKAGGEYLFHTKCWRRFKRKPTEAIR